MQLGAKAKPKRDKAPAKSAPDPAAPGPESAPDREPAVGTGLPVFLQRAASADRPGRPTLPDERREEIPEGGGVEGIDRLASIQRELKEETGIEASAWRELFRIHLSNSVTDEIATIFLATGLSFGEPEPDDTEALQLRKLPFEDAYQMALDGRITDAISVAALQRVKLLQLEGELDL